MKKAVLTTLAIVIALTTALSLTGFAGADSAAVTSEAEAVRLGLAIRAPALASTGEPLEIQVLTQTGNRPVEDAEVWAVNLDNVTTDTTLAADVASLQLNGVLLGTTNERGYVDPAPQIQREGQYILVAIKAGYDPGFTMMKITGRLPLYLRAPDQARAGQPVTLTVVGQDGQGIPRVALFAVPLLSVSSSADYDRWIEEAETYVAALGESETTTSPVTDAATNTSSPIRPYFIGFTDDSGQLTHRFQEAGLYLLIAAKYGYAPDFSIIKIVRLQLEKAEPASLEPSQTQVANIK